MQHKIEGGSLPVLTIDLAQGESIICEKGKMSWMSPNISMETNMKGGLMKGLGRAMTGESVFLNTYTCNANQGLFACCSTFPGDIIAMKLGAGESIIAQKGAFLCAEAGVEVSVHLRSKVGVGLFGGEGFLMQKYTGPGWVFMEICGSVIHYDLKQGEEMTVDPGHLAIMSPSIDTKIETVKGIKNIAFGGEGLLISKVKGPGQVWLQSMPLRNLAKSIYPYLPIPKSSN